MKLSAIVISKDEERYISKCLESLKFCDEIVVVDDNSTDDTAKIAGTYTKFLYKRNLESDFSSQRNFGASKATGDYLLFIDADEEVSEELKFSILNELKNPTSTAYGILRKDILFGKKISYGESGKYFVRLIRKGTGDWKRSVHESLNVNGNTGKLKGDLIHHSHDNLSEFITSLNSYSEIHALENIEEGKRSDVFKIMFYPIFKFIYLFVWKKGFLDGLYGLVSAILMSFHSFLSWSRMYLLQSSSSK